MTKAQNIAPQGERRAAKSAPGRAADDLIRHLSEQISTGVLREGQPLPPEREIVETYGVSRTVVREAIKALSNKGLIEARPRYRPVVRKPSYEAAMETLGAVAGQLLKQPSGIQNLFDTRVMVEAALARQAAREASDEDVEALRLALEANCKAVDDNETFFRTDMQFHAVLYAIPGNPVLPALQRAYTDWLFPHWTAMPLSSTRNRTNAKSHRAIYEAIRGRDQDGAEDALRRHLRDAWRQVRMTFGEEP